MIGKRDARFEENARYGIIFPEPILVPLQEFLFLRVIIPAWTILSISPKNFIHGDAILPVDSFVCDGDLVFTRMQFHRLQGG